MYCVCKILVIPFLQTPRVAPLLIFDDQNNIEKKFFLFLLILPINELPSVDHRMRLSVDASLTILFHIMISVYSKVSVVCTLLIRSQRLGCNKRIPYTHIFFLVFTCIAYSRRLGHFAERLNVGYSKKRSYDRFEVLRMMTMYYCFHRKRMDPHYELSVFFSYDCLHSMSWMMNQNLKMYLKRHQVSQRMRMKKLSGIVFLSRAVVHWALIFVLVVVGVFSFYIKMQICLFFVCDSC